MKLLFKSVSFKNAALELRVSLAISIFTVEVVYDTPSTILVSELADEALSFIFRRVPCFFNLGTRLKLGSRTTGVEELLLDSVSNERVRWIPIGRIGIGTFWRG